MALLSGGGKNMPDNITPNIIPLNKTQHLAEHNMLPLKKFIELIGKQTSMDIFEWNTASHQVTIRSSFIILSNLEKTITETKLKAHLEDVFITSENKVQLSDIFNRIKQGEDNITHDFCMKAKESQKLWIKFSLIYAEPESPDCNIIIGILEDITKEKELFSDYLYETQFYHILLSEKDASAHVDITEDKILMVAGLWNLYNEFIPYQPYSKIAVEFINKVVHPEDRAHYITIMSCDYLEKSFEDGVHKLECEFRRILDQNKMVWMELNIHLFRHPLHGHLMGLIYITNIDARKKQNLLLHFESERDQLTNIYNKKIAESLIRKYLQNCENTVINAFMILDLDDFKGINDTYGHQAGDIVLVRFAGILKELFDHEDIIGRFGGDEFIVLLKDIDTENAIIKQLDILYHRLMQEFKPPMSCSIGISLLQENTSYEQAFLEADDALYQSKRAGKGRFTFYKKQVSQAVFHSLSYSENRKKYNLTEKDASLLLNSENAKNMFDTFIGEIGEMAYLINPKTFDFICANKAFFDRIGLTEAECQGRKCYDIIHKRKTPCPFCSKASWSSDKFFIWKNRNDILEQDFLIKNKLVNWQGSEALLALSIDISNNKSIVDSIDNATTESHLILSGIQRMEACETLQDAMTSVLETIGKFFMADAVMLWIFSPEQEVYDCLYQWKKEDNFIEFSQEQKELISTWILEKEWNTSFMIESPENMLGYSYPMYQLMKANTISNQRWILLSEHGNEYGYINVINSSSNLQNIFFLESISGFIANEMKKYKTIAELQVCNNTKSKTDIINLKTI